MTGEPKARPALFTPMTLRGAVARNRIVISPMCQYSASENGMPNEWHHVHLSQFALGGAGIVIAEASAVEPRGRITYGDTGLWNEAQAAAFKPTVGFIKRHGALAGIQIAHAGRKASVQRPWHGNGPMDATDVARGEPVWQVVAPSPLPVDDGWLVPHELTLDEIAAIQQAFVRSAKLALSAGFEVLEIHQAHGYLGTSFLSPVSNKRNDEYGVDRAGRMRFTLETVRAVRAAWPAGKPLFVRVSSVDGAPEGWNLDDSVVLAKALGELGVDVVDCSSGGISGAVTAARVRRTPGFQVPFASQIRHDAGIATMAVGLILDGPQAEAVLAEGHADLIAIGRQALYDPYWAHHAAHQLGMTCFADWPEQYGWWLERRNVQLSTEDAARATARAA